MSEDIDMGGLDEDTVHVDVKGEGSIKIFESVSAREDAMGRDLVIERDGHTIARFSIENLRHWWTED